VDRREILLDTDPAIDGKVILQTMLNTCSSSPTHRLLMITTNRLGSTGRYILRTSRLAEWNLSESACNVHD
jgi:hypothetical protein